MRIWTECWAVNVLLLDGYRILNDGSVPNLKIGRPTPFFEYVL